MFTVGEVEWRVPIGSWSTSYVTRAYAVEIMFEKRVFPKLSVVVDCRPV